MPDNPPAGGIAHWSLQHDERDAVAGRHARNHGVVFRDGAATFNGQAFLEVADHPAFNFGNRPFTLTAWIDAPADLPDVVGDIASKFDPDSRRGFNLAVIDHGGVTSAQSNYRHLQFGIDAGEEPACLDCGRPGQAALVFALTAHEGELYAATFEHGPDLTGGVYRYDGRGGWINCRFPAVCNAVSALASLGGRLYAATGFYDFRGSALSEPGNHHDTPRAYCLEPTGQWTDCGAPPGQPDLHNLAIHRGKLYATPSYSAGLYRYDGEKQWTTCAPPYTRFFALSQWRGHLYAAANRSLRHLGPPPERKRIFTALPDSDGVYRYDDQTDAWTPCGKIEEETQMYAFAVHQGKLRVATWPNAKVFSSDSGIGWEDLGRIHPAEQEIMAMNVYNGKLYVGTLPGGDVYRCDGPQRWTKIASLDRTPDVKYRRVWSMAVHNGTLFAGTLPSGHVHAIEAGAAVGYSRELPAGWQHLAAVRSADRLQLYLNGRLVADKPLRHPLNLANTQPLRIGMGEHDGFHGRIADVRLYDRALTPENVASLHRDTAPISAARTS